MEHWNKVPKKPENTVFQVFQNLKTIGTDWNTFEKYDWKGGEMGDVERKNFGTQTGNEACGCRETDWRIVFEAYEL